MTDNDRVNELILDALDGDEKAHAELRAIGATDRLEKMRRAEDRLAQLFEPGAIERHAPPRIERGGIGSLKRAAAIALIGGVVAGAYLFYDSREDPIDASSAHRAFVINPNPSVVCDTPEKFLDYTTLALGEPIGADFDTGITLVGWRATIGSYDPEATGQPRTLLAYDEAGDEVVVIFQPARFPRPEIDETSGLTLFGERLGDVEVWEVTRGAAPSVLPLLSLVP